MLRKCLVFSLQTTTGVYSNFPFQQLGELDLVFERNVFHHPSCADKGYQLDISETEVNKECENLRYCTSLQTITKRRKSNDDNLRRMNNKYRTYKQLDRRIKKCREYHDNLMCKHLNTERRLQRMGKTLELHEHFLYLIKENKIHNLHELVNVALRNNRSMRYILDKMVSAVKGLYIKIFRR